jgi:YD repeat-containing protein
VTSVTDALGNVTRISYNALNKPTQITDALGRVTTYRYDAAGNLIEQIDPAGILTTYAYDGNGRLIRMTGAACCGGIPHQFVYDGGLALPTQVIDETGAVTRYEYNVFGLPTRVVDANGRETLYTYDDAGLLLRRRRRRQRDRYSYDANGNLTSITDALNQTTRYEYDASNRLTRTIDPLGGERPVTSSTPGQRRRGHGPQWAAARLRPRREQPGDGGTVAERDGPRTRYLLGLRPGWKPGHASRPRLPSRLHLRRLAAGRECGQRRHAGRSAR